jgi:ribulose kinase
MSWRATYCSCLTTIALFAGSQAKNKPLMQLLASVCNVAVFIPPHPSAAVVMGAAMMGRCAANISEKLQGKPIETQEEQGRIGVEMQSELWNVMVCPRVARHSW